MQYKTHDAFNHPNIRYGFFTRHNGVSEGVYKGLNCGFGSKDNPESVAQNRAHVADVIGVKSEQLLSPYQIHSAEVVTVTELFKERPDADALVTNQPNIALSVLTADCTPVLFKSQNGVIGAAHAGWKGALSGVLENTIKAMQKLGAQNISACIGPCIHQDSYEVQDSFKRPFLHQSHQNDEFFDSGRSGHLQFDLPAYCRSRLLKAGLVDITQIEEDTYKSETDYFSYRRSVHKKESDYGRQISVICITE